MTSWITGSVTVFNVTYIFNVPISSDNHIPDILMSTESTDVNALNDSTIINNLNEVEAFSKLVMVFIAVSSALSFVLFINALVCTYKCDWLWKKCTTPPEQDDQIKPLDPFR